MRYINLRLTYLPGLISTENGSVKQQPELVILVLHMHKVFDVELPNLAW